MAGDFFSSAAPGNGKPSTAETIDRDIAVAQELVRAGHFQQAAATVQRAADLAQRIGDRQRQSRALLAASGCLIRTFDYRGAQRAAEGAGSLASATGDSETEGAAAVNLASIYLQLGDYVLAGKEAGRAADLLRNTPKKERLVKALLIYANTEAERIRNRHGRAGFTGDMEKPAIARMEGNYRQGIAVAHKADLPRLEANLWEELGYSFLLLHLPARAEDPLRRASELERSERDTDALATNNAHRAELELQRGNYRRGLELSNAAFASHSLSFRTTPQFYSLHVRGLLFEKLNQETAALTELRRAVAAADQWRQGALPGDATSTRTVVVLHDVYSDYALLAADRALRTGNDELARDALEVLAANRAANLRAEIALALSQRQKLPARYFDLLVALQAAQARVTLGENRLEDKQRLEQARLEIIRIENDFAFLPTDFSQNSERSSHKKTLRDIQGRLSRGQALLSYAMGSSASFVWAVTQERVSVYRLAGEDRIGDVAREFTQAVRKRQDGSELGRRLSHELFGALPRQVWDKCEWLIVGDGPLLEGLPFAAVADRENGGKRRYLAESHTIRLIPSELLLLSGDKIRAQQMFVGIGDPIYNFADTRVPSGRQRSVHPEVASMALARLPGSAREIRNASRQSGMPQSQVLLGSQATVDALRKAIAGHPQILHFAVHVAASSSAENSGIAPSSSVALALSLTKENLPELLTPEAIAALQVPGSLVILSGCSSQSAEVLPGAGLMGLSRAWLLAGASAVVVSAWPTPDDSGAFFSSFYSHFNADSSGTLGERAARALEQAQLDMSRDGGYRGRPSFWAAYSIISKE